MRRLLLSLCLLLLAVPVSAQQLINGNRVITGTLNACLATGSSNAYLCPLDPAITAYTTRQCFLFQANHTNTGVSTLNINGLGAKTIKKWVAGVSTDLAANDIATGQLVNVCYDGTNLQVQSISAPGGGGGGSGDIATIANCTADDCGTAAGTGLQNISMAPMAAPGTPASTRAWLYIDSTSKNIAVKDDAGTVKHGMQTKTPVTNEFVTGWNSAGVASTGALAFSMIPGVVTNAQLPTTLDGKRVNLTAVQLTDAGVINPNADTTVTGYLLTLSQATLFAAPSGTPWQGQVLTFRITSSTARALTWNGIYSAAAGYALPTTTTGGGTEDYFIFKFNADTNKWVLIGTSQSAVAFAVNDFDITGGTIVLDYTNGQAAGTGTKGFLTAAAYTAFNKGRIYLHTSAARLPTTNFAQPDGSLNTFGLLFDASTQECAWWDFEMPADYASGLVAKIPYTMLLATSGGVSVDTSVMAIAAGAAALLNTDSYATVNNCDDAAVPGTAGHPDEISCTQTNADSAAANDSMRWKLCRAVADASDTATGDLRVYGTVVLEYNKQ